MTGPAPSCTYLGDYARAWAKWPAPHRDGWRTRNADTSGSYCDRMRLDARGCAEAQSRSNVITNDVLYQLSYCGGPNRLSAFGYGLTTPAPDIGHRCGWQEER